MLDEPVRRTPRASRLMIDLLHAVASCADLIQDWDIGKRPEGIVLHARSRTSHPSEAEAVEAAEEIARRVLPRDYDGKVVNVVARPECSPERGWYGVVEVVLT